MSRWAFYDAAYFQNKQNSHEINKRRITMIENEREMRFMFNTINLLK